MADTNGLPSTRSDAGTPPLGLHGYRRTSGKTSPGQSDRSRSPISRTNTPGAQHNSNIAPQHMFDSVTLGEQGLNTSTSLPNLQLRNPSPTSTSSVNDRLFDAPQTYEGLIAANTSLKTRVSELEVINGLFRGRVAELEQSDATARRSEMVMRDSEARLRRSAEEAQTREEELKRRIFELELQLGEHGTYASNISLDEHPPKKIRLSDMVDYGAESQPKSPKSLSDAALH